VIEYKVEQLMQRGSERLMAMAVLFLAILMAFTDIVEAGIHEKRLIEAGRQILYSSYSKNFSKSFIAHSRHCSLPTMLGALAAR
jgi:hypothetical protein